MEEIRDTELDIVGERYRSFLEFYRVNDARPLNALYQEEGDGVIDGLFEVEDGVMFSPADTREALLYGTDMYHEKFEQAKIGARRVLRDKYEWLAEDRFESDTHGQHVIVERHVLGHPESFSRRRPNMTRKRSVRILYDAMCPASTPLAERIEAGCSVLAAAEALELVGYEVALSFLLAKYSGSNVKGDPTLVLDISLKGFGERLLPAKTEFPLASKSMLFHVGCWWARRFPRTPVNYGQGEGYALSYDKGRLEAIRAYAKKMRGVYVSEDVVEVQLESDPVQVLEHVITGMGEERELLAHLRGGSKLAAGTQPEQGKMFASWDPTNGDGDDWSKSTSGDGDDWSKSTNGDRHSNSDVDKPGDELQQVADAGAREDIQEAKQGEDVPEPGSGQLGESDANGSSCVNDGCSERGVSGNQDGLDGMQERSEGRSSGQEGQSGEDTAQNSQSVQDLGDQKMPNEGNSKLNDGNEELGLGGGSAREKGTAQDAASGGSKNEGAPGNVKAEEETGAGSREDAAGEDEEDGIESESEGAAMASEAQENGIDFTQITKALDDDMLDADPVLPQSAEEFVVMLRRRYMMFEQGDYLNMMIGQKMANRKEAKAREASGVPLAPPPSVDAPTIDNVQFGAPRNTPFSMTSIPHKKN